MNVFMMSTTSHPKSRLKRIIPHGYVLSFTLRMCLDTTDVVADDVDANAVIHISASDNFFSNEGYSELCLIVNRISIIHNCVNRSILHDDMIHKAFNSL